MAQKKLIRVHNKSDKPNNLLLHEEQIIEKCEVIEKKLPSFLKNFFIYLRGSILPMSRLAYLQDIRFFCSYLLSETDICAASEVKMITKEDFNRITGRDINIFIGDYCRRYKIDKGSVIYIYENGNRSLSRKKSSLSVMFRHLYRDGVMNTNIAESFDPIKMPKPGEREIKALEDEEVVLMLDAVKTGLGLTDKEKDYWKKTRKRDTAILMMFVTYGLRLSELVHLNLSSFNFNREEFKIYRKRGKESIMPLNRTVTKYLREYIQEERESITMRSEEEDALFISLQGNRMTERAIRELVKKYTSIGMQTSRGGGYSPHKLRATAATSLIGRGNSIYDVQNLLDHDNITTTQLYAAHKKNAKRELIKGFEWDE